MLRSTLLKLAESPGLAHWVTSNGKTRGMARRFVAGETLDDAIIAARACNSLGMYASLDYLGENVATTTDAQRARDAYLEIFDRIAEERLHANVSCKLTQLGLDYRLMTQFTSFVAVEEMTVTDGGQPRRVEVPVEMPEGVSHDGVFGTE